ncbi:MAG: ComF family protein [Paracoccaceae bacterium]
MGIESALKVIFPPACVGCAAPVDADFGLCARCWPQTYFIGGLVCDKCGVPLPGEDEGRAEYCDDCLTIARPWERGRAVLIYKDKGRDLVLGLKHADRLDLVRPLAGWMSKAAGPLVTPGMIAAPVPLHWRRLLQRRYNQSALLSRAIAAKLALAHCPDLLQRHRRTETQEGKGREARFANLDGAIRAHPRRRALMAGRHVLLIDDVMTSGATFAGAAEACLGAGASAVSILTLARVAKDA